MPTVIITLFAALLVLPTAWAGPQEEEKDKKNKAIEIVIDTEAEEKSSKASEMVDKLVEKMTTKLGPDEEADGHSSKSPDITVIGEKGKIIPNVSVEGDAIEGVMAMLIGLVSVVFIFGGPIIIVAIALFASHRKRRLTHNTIAAFVESGKEVPPEVLAGLHRETSPRSNLHKGIVMVGIGLGVFSFFALAGSAAVGALGLIPLFIGIAQLVVWKLEKRNENSLEH